MAAFERIGVMPEIIEALEDMDWSLPTAVQDEAIPLILGGGDVMIAAETGSGKTGAFGIPVVQLIYEKLRGHADIDIPTVETKWEPVWENGALKVQIDATDRQPFFAVGPGGLSCQTREVGRWGGARGDVGFVKGKVYYEVSFKDEGLGRVGWALGDATYDIGKDDKSWGYGGTAKKAHNRAFDTYGETYQKGDTIGCFLDADNGSIAFSKNGKYFDEAFKIGANLLGKPIYPAIVLKNAEVDFNFGSKPLKYRASIPDGYRPCTAALKEHVSHLPKPKKKKKTAKHRSKKSPLAVLVEPTRELAKQAYEEIVKFSMCLNDPPFNSLLASGAGHHGDMARELQAGGVHLIVGTLGTMKGLIKSRKLDVTGTLYFLVDEADSMLDQGSKPDIMYIYNALPTDSKALQIILCSATLHSPEINQLAEEICHHPTWVDLKGKDSVPETVDHAFLLVDPQKDLSWQKAKDNHLSDDDVHAGHDINGLSKDQLSYGVKMLKPEILIEVIDAFKMEQCLIFCRTRIDCEHMSAYLTGKGGGRKFMKKGQGGKENNYSNAVLHGGKGRDRQINLDCFKEGDIRFLICTDVAARGIDIKNLPYVINVTLPEPSEQYIHRIGRVGRAGCPGLAISLVSSVQEKVWWHTCKRKDRGAGCRNRTLLDKAKKNGCCKWFDEKKLKQEIETRLSKGKEDAPKIPWLDRQNLLKGREHFTNLARAPKGTDKLTKQLGVSMEHVDILRPTVKQLTELETQAQYNWLHLTYSGKWNQATNKKQKKLTCQFSSFCSSFLFVRNYVF